MVMFAFVVVLVIAPPGLTQETPTAEKDFDYFRAEAKWTEKLLHGMFDEVDVRLREYAEELKTSNNASSALKRYMEAAEADAACAATTDEFNNAQDNIESAIAVCVRSLPQEDKNNFKAIIDKSIAKTREIDNMIRQNSIICSSLRMTPPPSCKATEKKLLKDIEDVMSCSERDSFYYHIAVITKNSKDYIDECVQNGTKHLQGNLEVATKNFDSCKQQSVL